MSTHFKNSRFTKALGVGSVLLLTACGGRLGDFTLMTSKQFNAPVRNMTKLGRVTGEDCSTNFLFVTLGHETPSLKSAVDQAIEKEGAHVLIDAVVEWNKLNLIIYSSDCFAVTGTAAKIQ